MKNFTQKFIGLLALLFTMSFNATSQDLELDYLDTNVLNGKEQSTYQLFLSVPSTSLIPDPSLIDAITIYNAYITTSTSFYNHESLNVDVGGGYNHWPAPFYSVVPDLQFDSWLTIGNSLNTSSIGVIFGDNYIDVSGGAIFSQPGDIDFSEFYDYDPDYGGSVKILIGQFTTDGELNVNLDCSIISPFGLYEFLNLNAGAGGVITGCTDPAAFNYNPIATEDNGSCVAVVNGCLNEFALNYNTDANTDDGSCIIAGCTDIEAFNYNEEATEDNGSCVAVVYGCMDEFACNYNSDANIDDSSCYSAEQYYDCNDVCLNDSDQDGVCDEIEVVGCTDSEAFNYNDDATDDNGSCVAVVNGCMDSSMSNYNSEANTEDSSCVSWEELANNLQFELDNVVPEDGISQSDVDAAYLAGAASVDITTDNQASFDAGVASVIPEDGVSQADVDSAYLAGVASVEVPECEEVATQNMPLDLPQGWSMFGYTCLESLDVVQAFSGVSDNIEIVKDEWGLAYLPAWGFSAFSNLEFGEGYQIKMIEEVTDFQFCTTIAGGASQDELDAAIAEVHAMYEGWCESDLDNDGICDVDEVSGCMDASSCNYVSEAEFDDGSCDYESCLDVCGVINGDNSSCTDCAGIVNGTSEDFGCGCGVPAASAGYDCDGNQLPDNDDIWISIGLPDWTCPEVAVYWQNYMNSTYGLGSYHPCETTLDWITDVDPGMVGAPLFDFCPATCYNLAALEGCTDAEALNYNPYANVDDGSCILAYGDVTSDGTLNVGDIVLLAKAILNNDDIGVNLSGDTNQDGQINLNDVVSLFNEILNDESSGYPTAQENANINLSFENGTLYYESNVEIYGFQFSTNEPSEFFVSSEVEATNFNILSSDNTTLGFSFAATYLNQTGETSKPLGSFEGITGLYEDAFAGFLFVDQFGATIPYNINFP